MRIIKSWFKTELEITIDELKDLMVNIPDDTAKAIVDWIKKVLKYVHKRT